MWCIARIIADDAQWRPTSRTTAAAWRRSCPRPPSSAGMSAPSRPSARNASTVSLGKRALDVHVGGVDGGGLAADPARELDDLASPSWSSASFIDATPRAVVGDVELRRAPRRSRRPRRTCSSSACAGGTRCPTRPRRPASRSPTRARSSRRRTGRRRRRRSAMSVASLACSAEDRADLRYVHGHAGAASGWCWSADGDRQGQVASVAEADVDVLGVDPGSRGELGGAPGSAAPRTPGRPSAVRISTVRRSTPSAVPISLRTASLAAKRAASEDAPPVAYDACSPGV